MMKRIFYTFCFIILGILVSFLVHAAIEISMIGLLLSDFDRYGLGLRWEQWYLVHHIGAMILFVCGTVLGYWQGLHWWNILYDAEGERRKK